MTLTGNPRLDYIAGFDIRLVRQVAAQSRYIKAELPARSLDFRKRSHPLRIVAHGPGQRHHPRAGPRQRHCIAPPEPLARAGNDDHLAR